MFVNESKNFVDEEILIVFSGSRSFSAVFGLLSEMIEVPSDVCTCSLRDGDSSSPHPTNINEKNKIF